MVMHALFVTVELVMELDMLNILRTLVVEYSKEDSMSFLLQCHAYL